MENLANRNLAFFMDIGGSLKMWGDVGLLNREVKLYNLLAKKFKKIYFFTYGDHTDLIYNPLLEKNIEIIPKKKSKNTPLYNLFYELLIPFRFYRILKNCDIYKTNQNSGAIAPIIAKLLHPKNKLIIRNGYIGSVFAKLNHAPIRIKIYLFLEQLFSYLICDKAFTSSEENFNLLTKKYPFLRKKLIVLNNFIDTELFKKQEISKKYDIIYVARIDQQQKNHIALLEATNDLNLKILFIGRGDTTKLTDYQLKYNMDLTIIKKIPNDKLPSYYNASKICVFPSIFEGNPKALLEAMSCELPVIAFNVPGIKNIITNNKNGVLSNIDIRKMKENILKIISDHKLQKTLGINARYLVEEKFSLSKIFQQELDEYYSLLNKK